MSRQRISAGQAGGDLRGVVPAEGGRGFKDSVSDYAIFTGKRTRGIDLRAGYCPDADWPFEGRADAVAGIPDRAGDADRAAKPGD